MQLIQLDKIEHVCDALLNQPQLEQDTDLCGRSLLHYAAEAGSLPVLQFLLKRNPSSVDARNLEGRTAFSVALLCGNFEAANLLNQCGARHDLLDEQGHAPVHQLCAANLPKALEVLLEYPGVVIDQPGRAGITATMVCCQYDFWECINILVSSSHEICICFRHIDSKDAH